MSRGFLAAVAVLIVLAGAAALVLASARPASVRTPRAVTHLPTDAALHGTWQARGVVKTSRAAVDEPVGTVLDRRWVFYVRCGQSNAPCEQWLARETASVVEEARVVRSGERLTAVFTRNTDGCGTSRTGKLIRTFTITPGGGLHLKGEERMRGEYPGCTVTHTGNGIVETTVSWSVRKVDDRCPAQIPDCQG